MTAKVGAGRNDHRALERAGSPNIQRPGNRRVEQAVIPARSMLVEGRILLDEIFLFLRYIVKGVNRVGGAGRNAGATVNAAFGIDIHLSGGFELRLVLFRVNAVGGANFNAEGVLNTGIGDYIGHDESISRMK
jgi:hypothetical protein